MTCQSLPPATMSWSRSRDSRTHMDAFWLHIDHRSSSVQPQRLAYPSFGRARPSLDTKSRISSLVVDRCRAKATACGLYSLHSPSPSTLSRFPVDTPLAPVRFDLALDTTGPLTCIFLSPTTVLYPRLSCIQQCPGSTLSTPHGHAPILSDRLTKVSGLARLLLVLQATIRRSTRAFFYDHPR